MLLLLVRREANKSSLSLSTRTAVGLRSLNYSVIQHEKLGMNLLVVIRTAQQHTFKSESISVIPSWKDSFLLMGRTLYHLRGLPPVLLSPNLLHGKLVSDKLGLSVLTLIKFSEVPYRGRSKGGKYRVADA